MNASKTLEKVQVASAIYDYIATAFFAIPIIAAWHLGTSLHGIHTAAGFAGSFPAFDPFHLLFANLFGAFAVMWSTLRIIKRMPIMGLCDGLLRSYYAVIMLAYVLVWQTSSILYIFIALELFWGTWQLLLYFAARKQQALS